LFSKLQPESSELKEGDEAGDGKGGDRGGTAGKRGSSASPEGTKRPSLDGAGDDEGGEDGEAANEQTGNTPDAQLQRLEVSVSAEALGATVADGEGGVSVMSLVKGGEAERLGVRVGDLLVAINGLDYPLSFFAEKKKNEH